MEPAGTQPPLLEGLSGAVERWLAVHVAQLVLAVSLGWPVYLLLRDLAGPAAAVVARAAAVAFVVLFSAFDAFSGIGA